MRLLAFWEAALISSSLDSMLCLCIFLDPRAPSPVFKHLNAFAVLVSVQHYQLLPAGKFHYFQSAAFCQVGLQLPTQAIFGGKRVLFNLHPAFQQDPLSSPPFASMIFNLSWISSIRAFAICLTSSMLASSFSPSSLAAKSIEFCFKSFNSGFGAHGFILDAIEPVGQFPIPDLAAETPVCFRSRQAELAMFL